MPCSFCSSAGLSVRAYSHWCVPTSDMPVRQVIEHGRVPVKIYTDQIEAGAREQLINLSRLPVVYHHVAAMPDVHAGIGATRSEAHTSELQSPCNLVCRLRLGKQQPATAS